MLLSISATSVAEEIGEIKVERTEEAVIVRSGTDQANFLFRVPAAFTVAKEPAKSFQLDLVHGDQRVRLRITFVSPGDSRKEAHVLARAREAEYTTGRKGKLEITADGATARASIGRLTVLLVRDGTRLYELWLEGGDAVQSIADGFTILDPEGGPVTRAATPEQLKARKLEHDYYRLKLLKPDGFTQEPVDPNEDKGIWTHLRCEDEVRNLCNIRIRVHLARILKQDLTAKATLALNRFAQKYPNARVPKRAKNTRWPGAKQALRLKMSGRLTKSGIVIQEEWVFVEHENGRIYEFQMTTYAGAQRAFKKQIKAFWKSIRIKN